MKIGPPRRLLLLAWMSAAVAWAGPAKPALAVAAVAKAETEASRPVAIEPSPAGPAIGQLVLHVLETGHYERHRITETESRRFLRNYVESYDYSHMFFTKADVDGFEADYGAVLGERVRAGDVGPAYVIFNRFMTRLRERHALVRELTTSTFTFTADESLSIDWRKAPWPATPEEVRDLWRRNVKYELLRARMDAQKPEDQVKTVNTNYDNLLENFKEFDAVDVLQNFLASLCRVYDPHSDYLAAPREENFNISMRLALVGIGASLRSEGGWTRIQSLIPGGPADVDKRLKPGDKIEAVAQGDEPFLEVVGMKLDRLVGLIRGAKGTAVRLRVVPVDAVDPSTRVVIRLVRDEIHLKDQEAKARLVTLHPPRSAARKFGVIRLPSFYADMQNGGNGKSTERDVEILLGALKKKGLEGLVLDLRDNGGGSLSEAVSLTGLFLGKGPVVQVKDGRGNVTVLDSRRTAEPYAGPVLVLTSRASASASEIFAAALQDYGRAVVMGNSSTFGKGTVQSVISLDSFMPPAFRSAKAGSVHLTIQKFYRVSGGSTQNRGVVPDIGVPSTEDYMDIAESSLPNALPYDQIPPAAFLPSAPPLPPPAALRSASAERTAASKEFGYLREDVETYRSRTKDKRVSLQEAKLRADKAADEDRANLRKKERRAAGAPKEDELEITLDALEGVPVVSTAPKAGSAASSPPARSTATAEAKPADYEKAPPAPDVMLEESFNVLSDMIAGLGASVAAHGTEAAPPTTAPESGSHAVREPAATH